MLQYLHQRVHELLTDHLLCHCASAVARMSTTARSFKGDAMTIGAALLSAFTIVEVYEKYKHVCIITHNTNRLASE